MIIYLLLSKSIVHFTWSTFSKVLSVVIRSVATPGWYVVGTTTINTYGVAHTCLDGYTAHFCGMRPSSESCAEHILMTIFPEMICTSTGGASYLRPTCVSLGAGARMNLNPSLWTLHFSSFRWFCCCFHLFLVSSERVNYFYFTSIMSRVGSIHVSIYQWFRCWCQSCCSLLWSCISNWWYGAVIIFIKTHTCQFFQIVWSQVWIGIMSLECILGLWQVIFIFVPVC